MGPITSDGIFRKTSPNFASARTLKLTHRLLRFCAFCLGCDGCLKYSSGTGGEEVCAGPQLGGFQLLKFHHSSAVTVEKGINLEVDVGYLAVTDPNPVDEEEYK